MSPEERQAILRRARALFNDGEYWLAHEALETIWRSIIREGDPEAARVWQGLIQAAAALLHDERGNRHGVEVVGTAALEKLGGPERPDVEFEIRRFRAHQGVGPGPEDERACQEIRRHDRHRHRRAGAQGRGWLVRRRDVAGSAVPRSGGDPHRWRDPGEARGAG